MSTRVKGAAQHQISAAPLIPVTRAVVGRQYLVHRPGFPARSGTVLNVRTIKNGAREAYVAFSGEDKRLDAWMNEEEVRQEVVMSPWRGTAEAGPSSSPKSKMRKAGKDISSPTRRANGIMPRSSTPSRRQGESSSGASTPEREHAAMTRVRNFEDVRIGEYLIKTWYYSPYPMRLEESTAGVNGLQHPPLVNGTIHTSLSSKKRKLDDAHEAVQSSKSDRKFSNSRSVNGLFAAGVGKGGEGARGRLWVCDLCFKYMRARAAWDKHSSSCDMLRPPGRRVYQKGSHSIYEVDGAQATLYCQNLSLFGKLFIDHKSVFYHVENFLFYVLCDAATSRRDGVMAFFSKEKLSYDDHNLACIVTFPPHQNRGFGKLLIEFSYLLTLHPSTRPPSLSPGTPERPLSDLGLKGYTAFWVSVVLRVLRRLIADAEPLAAQAAKSPVKVDGRPLRRKWTAGEPVGEPIVINHIVLQKISLPPHKGQHSINTRLSDLARACHLRIDDLAFTLAELGFLQHWRSMRASRNEEKRSSRNTENGLSNGYADGSSGLKMPNGYNGELHTQAELGEWKNVEVVVTAEMVDEMWSKWRVREYGVLEEDCVLL